MASNEWLAKRTRGHVEALLPKISTALKERDNSAQLDLATAENHLIRAELVELYKSAINERLTSEVCGCVFFDTSFQRRCGKQSLRLKHDELTVLQAFSYPSGFGGEPCLLRAFADFFNEYFQPHVPVDSSHLVAGPGATACLSALLCGICDLGDVVLVPGTYWSKCIPTMSYSPVAMCTTMSGKRCNR